MSRIRTMPIRRAISLRMLVATAALLGSVAPAVAQVKAKTDTPVRTAAGVDTARLTLENASPLPVPPPPKLVSPDAVKPPARFVMPLPVEPPPPPSINALGAVQPPAPVVGAPPVQATLPIKPKLIPPPTAPAKPAAHPPAQPAETTPAKPGGAPENQTATLPPSPPPPVTPAPVVAPPRSILSFVFDAASTELPQTAEAGVTTLAERMRANENLRLQLRSYASGTPEMLREARQLSLARALALRERLTALGVRSTRIDIRALGAGGGAGADASAHDGSPDRIDAEFLN